MFLKISQNWQENTCVGASFNIIEKETTAQVFSCEFCAKFLIYFGRGHLDDYFFKYLFRVVVKMLAFLDVVSLFSVFTLDTCLSTGKGRKTWYDMQDVTWDICSKLTKITPKRHWRPFVVTFEQMSPIVLVFPLLILNK